MKKIHLRFMKDILNIEFGELFDKIYNNVKTEKIDIASLTIAHQRLKPHSKEVLRMNYKKLRHPLTQLIQKQVTCRTEYLACLRLTVDAKMLSHKPEERIAAKRLLLWLRTYKNEIYAPTLHTQRRMMINLMDERMENVEIQQATALLNLDELLEELVKVDAKIKRNFLKRLNEKDIYDVNGKAIREAAYKDLKVLVSVIEASYNISVDDVKKEQLFQLGIYINEELKVFRTQLRSRNTKRKNKKDMENAVEKLISEPFEEKQESDNENLNMVVNSLLKVHSHKEIDINKNTMLLRGKKDVEKDVSLLIPFNKI